MVDEMAMACEAQRRCIHQPKVVVRYMPPIIFCSMVVAPSLELPYGLRGPSREFEGQEGGGEVGMKGGALRK